MMNYEILKVANGYLVRPAYDMSRCGEARSSSDVHVFETWERAAEWLREQFSKK